MTIKGLRKISETIVVILMVLVTVNALAALLKPIIGVSKSHFISGIALAGMALCGILSFLLMELEEDEETKRKKEKTS